MRQLDDDDDAFNEDPDESEMDQDIGDEYVEKIPCPYCRQMIYEEAERCPECGKYLSREDAPSHVARWVLITVILTLIAIFLFWVL